MNFRPAGQGAVCRLVRHRVDGCAARFDDPGVHGAGGEPDHGERPGTAVGRLLADIRRHGGGAAGGSAPRADRAEPRRQPGDLGERPT